MPYGAAQATLTDQQIKEIIRLRMGGLPYKKIAHQVKCTPKQAMHYWSTSSAYRPIKLNQSVAAKQRVVSNLKAWQAKRRAAIAAVQTRAAATMLQLEIADAVAEAPFVPPLKTGDLTW